MQASAHRSASSQFKRGSLHLNPRLLRNRVNTFFNALASVFAAIAVLPLVLVLLFVLLQGGQRISLQ